MLTEAKPGSLSDLLPQADPNVVFLRGLPAWPNYFAGEDGLIYSTNHRRRNRLAWPLKGSPDRNGYIHVVLCRSEVRTSKMVHRQIAAAFHGPAPAGMEVSHLDGNKRNNQPSNLRYETRVENLGRKKDHGTHDGGLANSRSVMTGGRLELVRELIAAGETNKYIASAVGVSTTSVSRVRSGRRYRDNNWTASPRRGFLFEALRGFDCDTELTGELIALRAGRRADAARQALWQAAKDGHLVQVRRGVYRIREDADCGLVA